MTDTSAAGERRLTLQDAAVQAWQDCLGPFNVYSYSFNVCLQVSIEPNDEVQLAISLTLGGTTYQWTEEFSGDISYTFPVVTGLSLGLQVSNWQLVPNVSISFTVSLKAYIFGFPVQLQSIPVTVPLSGSAERTALASTPVSSPVDLAALLGILSSLTTSTGTAGPLHDKPGVAKAVYTQPCWSRPNCTGQLMGHTPDCPSCLEAWGQSRGVPGMCQACW